MNDVNARAFSFMRIFAGMMAFCILVWMWTVAFIIAGPWEKSSTWQPQFRLAAICSDDQVCGIDYGALAAARAEGKVKQLTLKESGEMPETSNWLRWTLKEGGIYEVRASSWHFQTTIRYRIVDDAPVLIEYQDVGAKTLYYGIAGALFTLTGLYLRKLRRR